MLREKFFLSNPISIDILHLIWPLKVAILFGMPSDVHLLI